MPRQDLDYAISFGIKSLVLRHLVEETDGVFRMAPTEVGVVRYGPSPDNLTGSVTGESTTDHDHVPFVFHRSKPRNRGGRRPRCARLYEHPGGAGNGGQGDLARVSPADRFRLACPRSGVGARHPCGAACASAPDEHASLGESFWHLGSDAP